MNSDQYTTRAFLIGILGIVGIIASGVMLDTFMDNRAITKMVELGADPISASCAVGLEYNDAICFSRKKMERPQKRNSHEH